jgi:hypothetical protein
LTLLVGVGLFGTAVYRSGRFPRIAFALIGVGAVLFAAGPFVSLVLAAAGVLAIAAGFVLIGAGLGHQRPMGTTPRL